MSKNLTEQIKELEAENARLIELEKNFNRAVKNVFGYDSKTIKKILKEHEKNTAN